MALKDLDEYKISSFYKKLEMQGASNVIIHGVHNILDSTLDYSVAKRYLYNNPCKVVPLKKKPHPRPTIFYIETVWNSRRSLLIAHTTTYLVY